MKHILISAIIYTVVLLIVFGGVPPFYDLPPVFRVLSLAASGLLITLIYFIMKGLTMNGESEFEKSFKCHTTVKVKRSNKRGYLVEAVCMRDDYTLEFNAFSFNKDLDIAEASAIKKAEVRCKAYTNE